MRKNTKDATHCELTLHLPAGGGKQERDSAYAGSGNGDTNTACLPPLDNTCLTTMGQTPEGVTKATKRLIDKQRGQEESLVPYHNFLKRSIFHTDPTLN